MKKCRMMLCCLLLIIGGCASKPDAKQSVSLYLDNLKNGDLQAAAKITGENYDEREFGDSESSSNQMKKLMFSSLAYKVLKTNYDKSKQRAIVTVRLSNHNYLTLLEVAKVSLQSDPKTASLSASKQQEAIVKQALKMVKKAKRITQTVPVYLEKQEDDQYQIIMDNTTFHLAITAQPVLTNPS